MNVDWPANDFDYSFSEGTKGVYLREAESKLPVRFGLLLIKTPYHCQGIRLRRWLSMLKVVSAVVRKPLVPLVTCCCSSEKGSLVQTQDQFSKQDVCGELIA